MNTCFFFVLGSITVLGLLTHGYIVFGYHCKKHDILRPRPKNSKIIRVLTRVLICSSEGMTYEADQCHADVFAQGLGLVEAKPVSTPGCREDVDRMLADMGNPLPPRESTQYMALADRLNHLALRRPDIKLLTKEVARYMLTPSDCNWLLLKCLDRYLAGSPRLVQTVIW